MEVKLKIIPLGGLEQIGMNITVFEYEDSIIVVIVPNEYNNMLDGWEIY